MIPPRTQQNLLNTQGRKNIIQTQHHRTGPVVDRPPASARCVSWRGVSGPCLFWSCPSSAGSQTSLSVKFCNFRTEPEKQTIPLSNAPLQLCWPLIFVTAHPSTSALVVFSSFALPIHATPRGTNVRVANGSARSAARPVFEAAELLLCSEGSSSSLPGGGERFRL